MYFPVLLPEDLVPAKAQNQGQAVVSAQPAVLETQTTQVANGDLSEKKDIKN